MSDFYKRIPVVKIEDVEVDLKMDRPSVLDFLSRHNVKWWRPDKSGQLVIDAVMLESVLTYTRNLIHDSRCDFNQELCFSHDGSRTLQQRGLK